MDGASLRPRCVEVILPLVSPGIAATALICVIFSWNEFFFAVNLTADAGRRRCRCSWSASSPSEGLYLAQLRRGGHVAALPVVLAGWFAQDKLVRGLSFGAIK